MDDIQQAAIYGQIWQAVTRAEMEAIRLAEKYLGREEFVSQSGPFLELSFSAHDAVDALRSDFLKSFETSAENRAAFIKKYSEQMPTYTEQVYHGTLSLARALRDSSKENAPHIHKGAVRLVEKLEEMQPERAAEYRQMEKAARIEAEAKKPSQKQR